MRRKILPLILGGALSIAAVAPAAAQTPCEVTNVSRGGAAALVSLVQANIQNVGANVCDINVLNNSLNNLLRNADIHVLENILNRSPILSGNDIDVVVSGNDIVVTVLGAGAGGDDLVMTLIN